MNENNSYQPVDLNFDEEALSRLMSGIRKITKAVGSTLGPRGNTVIMESASHVGGMTVTKDGVTVAKSISLIDPVENIAVRIMRQASEKTANDAGDGTTTAMILAESIIENALEALKNDKSLNPNLLVRQLKLIAMEVVEDLDKKSIKLTKGRLKHVATISANNDHTIGDLIADTYKKVGVDGIVRVEKGQTSSTYSEITKGIKLDKGYASRVFANNQSKDECLMKDSLVLLSTIQITNILHIENVIRQALTEDKNLVIVAECSANVLNLLSANVARGTLKACVVQPPSFGYRQNELMSDIAVAIGATLFSEDTGQNISGAVESDLGVASSFSANSTEAVILTDVEGMEEVHIRVQELKIALELASTQGEKKHISSRIAALTGGVGIIYAGGETDMEQKELYDRIDDAIQAVKSAKEQGILPGGGASIYHQAIRLNDQIANGDRINKEKVAAKVIMSSSLISPMRKILENSGIDDSLMYSVEMLNRENTIDAIRGTIVPAIQSGIIDPAKVTKAALTNAVSVASTILTTKAVVTLTRSYEAH